MRHFVPLSLAAALLSGCVLHAPTPIFTDADATLALGTAPMSFAVFDREGDAWVPGDDPVIMAVPEANHYLVPDPKTPDDLTTADAYSFVALDAAHYLIQATAKGEADYAIATWDGHELLVSRLDCAALKSNLKTNPLVVFQDDSCALAPSDTAPTEVFKALMQALPAPDLRLVAQ